MVDIQVQAEVESVARSRMRANLPAIKNSLEHIVNGTPWLAEPSKTRCVLRLRNKAGLSSETATSLVNSWNYKSRDGVAAAMSEAVRGSINFVGVNFLAKGRRAADAVGRVIFLNGAAQGSGFMVGPGLFLTNHHVIESAALAAGFCVQFDYETEVSGEPRQPSSFLFDPARCFVTDNIQGLDFTLIAVGQRRAGIAPLERYGYIPLSDASDKHMLGETANLIQHPDGRLKELVLRENQLVARDETQNVLLYVADTERGSSGAPVFNNEWQAIALHHWGVPWKEVMGTNGLPLAREVNEGIRISSIVRHLTGLLGKPGTPVAVGQVLALWKQAPESEGVQSGFAAATSPQTVMSQNNSVSHNSVGAAARFNQDGSLTWTFPIEISVRGPMAPQVAMPTSASGISAEAKTWKQEEFDDRGGFEPGFVPGFVVDLPDYSKVTWRPAENQMASGSYNPHELKYTHFSIVMNADRRVCGFTAVNIDGSKIKAVNRDDKSLIDKPTPKELGVESLSEEGAEASDDFRPDRRILEDEQMNRLFYEKQVVAGFPVAKSQARIARIFQKGHVILRGDPAWGSDATALAAERDTFFYTNAAPQIGFFNQGSALNRPGSKGKLRWRAVETYVLRNALTMKSRVNVFAGPVFAADDPVYRFDCQVSMKFWKVAVWNEGGKLRSVALLADQGNVLEVLPESLGEEAFGDADELARVSEFLTTVRHIEKLTKLNFGADVRRADIRSGESATPKPLSAKDFEKLLGTKTTRKVIRKKQSSAGAKRKSKRTSSVRH